MSDLTEKHRREAALLTHLILDWHREVGTRLAPQRMSNNPESLTRYLHLLGSFLESDLSDPRIQNEIARQQLGGTFEWFYGEEIPPDILHRRIRNDDFEFELPSGLNAAAKRILSINEQVQDRAVHEGRQGRTVVRFSDHGDLLAKARQIYRAFTTEEEVGIGGANFLLACSIERHSPPREHAHQFNEITLIDETVLGVERVAADARSNDFLAHLRSRRLVVEAVVGQPQVSDLRRLNREE